MKEKIGFAIALSIVISFTLAPMAIQAAYSTEPMSSSASIAISPEAVEVWPGKEFTVTVTVNPQEGQVVGVQAYINFDTSFLEVREFTSDMTALPIVMFDPPYFDNTQGHIDYAAGILEGTPPSAVFKLATIKFRVKDVEPDLLPLTTIISFNSELPRITKVVFDGEEYPLNLISSNITIERLPGDANGEGKVNAANLALVATAFNTKPGVPNWNPAAELNKDGIVDIYDLVIVGLNFGREE